MFTILMDKMFTKYETVLPTFDRNQGSKHIVYNILSLSEVVDFKDKEKVGRYLQ